MNVIHKILIFILLLSSAWAQYPSQWAVDVHAFENSMTLTGALQINDMLQTESSSAIAAFHNDQCRGVVEGTVVGDQVVYFLLIHANSQGDSLEFRAWDATAGNVVLLDQQITFSSGAALGNVEIPYQLTGTNSVTYIEAFDDSFEQGEDDLAQISVLDNDLYFDSNSITLTIITQPEHGEAQFSPDDRILINFSPDYYGSDSLIYVLSNDWVSDTAQVTLIVLPVNDPPTLDSIPDLVFNEDSSDSLLLVEFTGDVDNELSELNYQVEVIGATNNLRTDTEDLVIHIDSGSHIAVFTCTADSSGAFTAVFTVTDDSLASDSDTMLVYVSPENDPPAEFSLLIPGQGELLTNLSPTFSWSLSSDPDLADNVSYLLIIGNNPGNIDTILTGSDTTHTLGNALDDNASYLWMVVAEDESGLTTVNAGGYQIFTVNQANDNPSVVDLITPDSVMVLSLTPEMNWTIATDVDPGDIVSYEMHWWNENLDFDSVLTDTNALQIPTELEDNTQYFWQVITSDLFGGISHSLDATFWTDLVPEAPALFALTSPENNAGGLGTTLSFVWEEAIDPDPMDFATYTLQIATDSNFTDITHEGLADINLGYDLTEELPIDTEYWWRVIATDTDSLTTESGVFKFTVGTVSIASIALPTEYVLEQNYPNPFNPSTTIRYGLPEEAHVSLVIYDIRGNVVQALESGTKSAGWYELVWIGEAADGRTISTGLYFARIVAGDYSQVIKMLYLK